LLIGLVVAVAAIAVAAVAPWLSHGPAPVKASLGPKSVAPAASAMRSQAKIYNSRISTKEFAAAVDDEVRDANGRVIAQASELQPLSVATFRRPIRSYRHYAEGQAHAMATSVARLVSAVRGGDRAAARTAWRASYERYLLLGAAYGALGDLDVAIDGGPGGLPRGTEDPKFSGLHRVEHELWTGTPLPAIVPWARRLQRDVAKLPRALAVLDITPLDYATRAHEILEDAQRDQLSGRAARWSGAGVTATAAGLVATERVMATLSTTLAGRGSAQQTVATRLGELRRRLASLRRAHGGVYPTLHQLTPAQDARLDGSLGAALEALALVPGALETTRPTIPTPIP